MSMLRGQVIHAPWPDQVVEALNHWQLSGVVHPYTCLNHSSTPLRATPYGWICLYKVSRTRACTYTQDWASDISVYRNPLGQVIIPHPAIAALKEAFP